MEFEKELTQLINKYAIENASNTPDFILAQYVACCLAAFATAVQQRETWYGRDARPLASVAETVSSERLFGVWITDTTGNNGRWMTDIDHELKEWAGSWADANQFANERHHVYPDLRYEPRLFAERPG